MTKLSRPPTTSASEHSVLTNETSNLSLQVTLSHIFLGDTMGLQEILKIFFVCVDAPIHFLRFFSCYDIIQIEELPRT